MAFGMTSDSVAVVGGGWAGCAAAVTLARAGVPVTLFESAPMLGGRARRVLRAGLPLDNGQHLLLGAYEQTLALLKLVHGDVAAHRVLARTPLTIVPLAKSQVGALTLIRGRAPGKLGLLTGLLSARGLTWRERIANIRWFLGLERTGFARGPNDTVARMLAPLPRRVAQGLWEPLCLAALNTPPATASAQVFANVLKAAFAGSPDASDFLLPATDLTAAFPEAAARFVLDRGGAFRTATRARIVRTGNNEITLRVGDAIHSARAVVVAVGPHQLDDAFAPEALSARPELREFLAQMSALAYEPIVTIFLGYADAPAAAGNNRTAR